MEKKKTTPYDNVTIEMPAAVLVSILRSNLAVAQISQNFLGADINYDSPEFSEIHMPAVFSAYTSKQLVKYGILTENSLKSMKAQETIQAFEDWLETHRLISSVKDPEEK